MTFKEYLSARKSARKPSPDAEGDVARLASADDFPDFSTAEDLQAHIIARHGRGPLSDAVPSLWRAYEIAKKKRRDA